MDAVLLTGPFAYRYEHFCHEGDGGTLLKWFLVFVLWLSSIYSIIFMVTVFPFFVTQ